MAFHARNTDDHSAAVSGRSQLHTEAAALFAVLPVLLLIGVFSMCIKGCYKKRQSSQTSDESELNQGEAGNGGSIKTIEVDLSNEANGRPLSHDRALPEIPAIPSGVMSTDDDDEEDEGHYDIISKNKRAAVREQPTTSLSAAACSSSALGPKKKPRSHPYEKVHGDPDSDSVYAGIKDEVGYPSSKLSLSIKSSGLAGPGMSVGGVQPSGAMASGDSVHSNLYATVGTGQSSLSSGLASFSKDSFPHSAQCLTMPVQSPELAGSGATMSPGVMIPSTSQERFELSEDGGSANGRHPSNPMSGSPSLPPRNGDGAAANQAADGISRLSSGGFGLGGLIPSMAPWTAMAAYPSLIINVNDIGSAAAHQSPTAVSSAKRVPDYSSVTARESLESLRKRQQQQQQQTNPMRLSQLPDIDGTYDTINYDQVKMPPAVGRVLASSSAGAENVYNNGSDLYAEIATETNSARSSTYAKVGDPSLISSSNISDCPPPPAPPSVNALQQITHANLDDHADPGYSRVDMQRPRSVQFTANTAVATSALHQPGGARSPVYAVVNKSRQSNRQTIHVDENIDWGFRSGDNDQIANLYAKVSKPKNHRRTSSSGASFALHETPPAGMAFGGARPKVRPPGAAEVGRTDHSYATIDNAVAGVGRGDDPDYDAIGDGNSLDGLPEYDPNYETVAVAPTGASSRSAANCGIALEIVPNGVVSRPRQQIGHIQTVVPLWHHPRREHIYEVVSDAHEGPAHSISNNSSAAHTTDL